ncbi:MAG: hypothetical protein ACTS22_09020 [Phycisphaerales bacterium]
MRKKLIQRSLFSLIPLCIGSAAAGQIVVGDYSIGGSASVSDLTGAGGSVFQELNESGTGDFDITRVLESTDILGRSIRLEQRYSVIAAGDSVTFTGSIRAFETPGGVGAVPQFASQGHNTFGIVAVTLPADVPLRITGTLTHDPLRFPANGSPVLLNGSFVGAGFAGLLADPLGDPADSFDAVDLEGTSAGGSPQFFQFHSDHFSGGVGEPLGFASVEWSVTVAIIPAPATLAIAPLSLLALRRRR